MKKITIVGSGFSGAFAKLAIGTENIEVISVSNPLFLKGALFRRRNIEINKLFRCNIRNNLI